MKLVKLSIYLLPTVAFILLIPGFLYIAKRIFLICAIDYNEGWNAFHTVQVLHGKPLYNPIDQLPLTPVNYPPVSFFFTAFLVNFFGSVLLTGRVISLISFLTIAYFLFCIIEKVTAQKTSAVIGTLFWFLLMTLLATHYVGMFDPQMLGHIFSIAAIYWYVKTRDCMNAKHSLLPIAILCCLSVFIKHLLISVPITLAICMFLKSRKNFFAFAALGMLFSFIAVVSWWVYAGEHLLANLIDFDRTTSLARMLTNVKYLFLDNTGWIFFIPLLLLLIQRKREFVFAYVYFFVSLLLGLYAMRGYGVDVNAWFDFFLATAIVLGVASATIFESINRKVYVDAIIRYTVVFMCFVPFLISIKSDTNKRFNYYHMLKNNQTYEQDIAFLQSVQGPALFEDILLGFEAGKEFLFEPFNGSQKIISGKVPEDILTQPITNRYFSVIVLNLNLENMIQELSKEELQDGGISATPNATLTNRWTDNTLLTIHQNYELIKEEPITRHYFYMPRKKEENI